MYFTRYRPYIALCTNTKRMLIFFLVCAYFSDGNTVSFTLNYLDAPFASGSSFFTVRTYNDIIECIQKQGL